MNSRTRLRLVPGPCPALLASLLGTLAGLAARGDTLEQAWAVAPLDRTYVTTANQERGIAFNPSSGKVLLLGRAGGPRVWVLDGATGLDGSETGADARSLSMADANGESPIAGGTFALNLVGTGSDGAVFACNLATSLGTVRIYRWANDGTETPVSVAFGGDPLEGISTPGSGNDIRFGDNFASRGAGKDTQLAQTSRNGKYIILYTTTNGLAFTPTVFVTPAEINGKIGLGLAFGDGNTLWAKGTGNALQRIELQASSRQAKLLGTVPTTVVSGNVTGLGVDPAAKRLAGIDYVAHTLTVFDISDPAGLVRIGDPLAFPAGNANGNGTGAAAVSGERVFAVESNNGVLAAKIVKSVIADPPSITTQPAGATVYAGAAYTLSVGAQGTPPFTYAWRFNDAPIAGATGAQLVLNAIASAQEGDYSVVVGNAAGNVTSRTVRLTVKAPLAKGILESAWALKAGDRNYLTTDNSQRGLAWNPATGRLLVATRSPAPGIAVLNATNGTHLHFLRTTGGDDQPLISGGTLSLNMVGVSDDGVVYAGNLVTDGSAASFRMYRWENDGPDAIPEVLPDVPELAVAERWGDTFDVRGKGSKIQILLGSRGVAPQEGRKFAILSATDGVNFSARLYTAAEAAGGGFGLGLAFGPDESVFGTANGLPVIQAGFQSADGTANLLQSFDPAVVPSSISLLAYDAASKLLAGVSLETPDNVRLYDLADPANPVEIDQVLLLPEETNVNGTGAVDFGGGRLFVLDTNHGVRAYQVRRGGTPGAATLSAAKVSAGQIGFNLTGSAGVRYSVQRSVDLRTWTDVGSVVSPGTYAESAAAGTAFFRAVAR